MINTLPNPAEKMQQAFEDWWAEAGMTVACLCATKGIDGLKSAMRSAFQMGAAAGMCETEESMRAAFEWVSRITDERSAGDKR